MRNKLQTGDVIVAICMANKVGEYEVVKVEGDKAHLARLRCSDVVALADVNIFPDSSIHMLSTPPALEGIKNVTSYYFTSCENNEYIDTCEQVGQLRTQCIALLSQISNINPNKVSADELSDVIKSVDNITQKLKEYE